MELFAYVKFQITMNGINRRATRLRGTDIVSFEIRQQDEGQGTKDSHDDQLSGRMDMIRVRVKVSIPMEVFSV
jgi:hypothetical protein